jgi:enamine deaminase RidA (YjgF/YER057c/UK114 family)
VSDRGRVEFIDPSGMHANPAFTHVVVASGSVRTVYVGAIDPVDASGAIVGKNDVGAQTEKVLENLKLALAAANAKPEHVVLWRIYLVQGEPMQSAFAAFQRAWGMRTNPPANTIVYVSALGRPDSLVAIEAVAVVPD